MRPAWRGIAGWLLMALAVVVALVSPWPLTGLTLLAVVLAALGGILVAAQIIRTSPGGPR